MHAAPPHPKPCHSRIVLTALLLLPLTLHAQQASLIQPVLPPIQPLVATEAKLPPQLIVIGFAGGFIKRTSSVHGEVGLALHLKEKYSATIHSEIFENHHGNEAHREILRLLAFSNTTGPGTKKQPARIILYGHSWGASEAVSVARQLQRDNIPVLLLVQVDGVQKREEDDSIIPANVAQAINFYQTEGLLHGRPTISAANPATTKILDNIQLTYKHNDVPTPGYPWIARTFTRRHIEIENDPRVWTRVEAMILANLRPPTP